MEDKNISQYVLNALNELKQLAKEKYELYILFINSYEQSDKKSIYDISLKLLDCISKKDSVFATLDKDSFKELYDFIDEGEEDVISQPSYISFLYEDIIEYYKSIYYDGEELDEDDYEETLEYEDDDEEDLIDDYDSSYIMANYLVYAYKNVFDILLSDSLNLKEVNKTFFDNMKQELAKTFFVDISNIPEFEILLLKANLNFENVEYYPFTSEQIKDMSMYTIDFTNNYVMSARNTLEILKDKFLFEYLVNNLDYEDFLEIKDYLYSLKKNNFTISEFKKVINENGMSYGR
jgi:hypothetical protein